MGCGRLAWCGHHIFGKKAYPSVRFNLLNGFPVCRGHHKFLAHDNPEKFRDIVIEWMGGGFFGELKFKANTEKHKLTIDDYIPMEDIFKEILDLVRRGENVTGNTILGIIPVDHQKLISVILLERKEKK
jgi:hypothetical protein